MAAERGGEERGKLRHRFDAQVDQEQQVSLGGGHRSRHAQAFRAVREVLRLDAQLIDLHVDVQRGLARRVGERGEQRLGHVFVGVARHLAHVAVVVLHRLRALAFQTAVDDQHDDDQQHDAHADGHAPAHHQGVLVDRKRVCRLLRTPGSWPLRRAGCSG